MEVKLPVAMAGSIDSMSALTHTKRARRNIVSTALICLVLFVYWHTHLAVRSSSLSQATDQPNQIQDEPGQPEPPCWNLLGSNNTVVILRTGSTELEDRFRIHLSTSLRCYPHFLIFSDYEESYHGMEILDALSTVNETIKSHHPDFELYRKIQSQGRSALKPSELSGSPEAFERLGGNAENPGWKLDKWKFMPMLEKTLLEYPDKKWYVFIEADSFLLWSMLQQYLSLLDPSEPYYIGSGSCMGEDLFAHGGSGFVASRPAMLLATQYYITRKTEIEAMTDHEWAGDFVLGKAFNEAGVKTTDAWPHFQGDYPGPVAYAGADGRYGTAQALRKWCAPTISYHHMSSEMIESLWEFEQKWIGERWDISDTLTHGDLFKEYVMPQMMAGNNADWDNLSDEAAVETGSVDECRIVCEIKPDCKQYSFVQAILQCKIRVDPRLGKPNRGIQSGWLADRVLKFAHDMPACGDEGWQVGSATRHTRCS